MTYDGVREAMNSPEVWPTLSAGQLARLAELATFIYGRTGDDALMDALPSFYPHFADGVPAEQRREVFARLATYAREQEVRRDALYPFLLCEDDPEIVAQAAQELALHHEPSLPDMPEGPEQVLALVLRGGVANPGAALAGLLGLGDADVCARLARLRPILAGAPLNHTLLQFVTTAVGPLHLSAMRFYVEWLEELAAEPEGHAFGHVASGLVILRRNADSHVVIDGRRRFPTPRAGVPYLPGVRLLSLEEAAREIEPQLRRVAGAERPPRILPRVFEAWGLELTGS
jgi:hypothetical protein